MVNSVVLGRLVEPGRLPLLAAGGLGFGQMPKRFAEIGIGILRETDASFGPKESPHGHSDFAFAGPAEHPEYCQRQDYRDTDQVPVVIVGKEVGRVAVGEVLP